jgi:transcriptional/translational regulatory protein YebC/TACO1
MSVDFDFDHPGKIYFGKSHEDLDRGTPATLEAALADVAEQAVNDGLVTPDRDRWFEVVSLKVLIANQHVKAYIAGATPQQVPNPGE